MERCSSTHGPCEPVPQFPPRDCCPPRLTLISVLSARTIPQPSKPMGVGGGEGPGDSAEHVCPGPQAACRKDLQQRHGAGSHRATGDRSNFGPRPKSRHQSPVVCGQVELDPDFLLLLGVRLQPHSNTHRSLPTKGGNRMLPVFYPMSQFLLKKRNVMYLS